ncbi:MAG TPA: hypothetical protein VIM10_09330 [Actinopolymorphaceae bacterium]|jgi:hypothetical protein
MFAVVCPTGAARDGFRKVRADMSRGAHAGPPKPFALRDRRVQLLVGIPTVVIGLVVCAAIGWLLVATAVRVGLIQAAVVVAVLAGLAFASVRIVRRRRARRAGQNPRTAGCRRRRRRA